MIYNEAIFGKALKELVLKKEDVTVIGKWAFTIYWEHLQDIDADFRELPLRLMRVGHLVILKDFAIIVRFTVATSIAGLAIIYILPLIHYFKLISYLLK